MAFGDDPDEGHRPKRTPCTLEVGGVAPETPVLRLLCLLEGLFVPLLPSLKICFNALSELGSVG